MTSKAFLSRATIALAFVIGVAAIGSMIAAANSDSGTPTLDCEEKAAEQPEQGDLAAKTPEEAVLTTEWLDVIAIPESSQHIVEVTPGGNHPDDGITRIDGAATEAGQSESTDRVPFQVYAKGSAIAQIVVLQAGDGSYYIGSIIHC
jgi:hypothetical protein